MSDLDAMLENLTRAASRGWRCRFEVDGGDWWLTSDGLRIQQTRWAPSDEADVLLAAQLLHTLNDAGDMPLSARILEIAAQADMDEDHFRLMLGREAYKLYIRLRRSRPARR
ncbi:hypothetical protein ABZ917_17090 [Nonomuraea wenchangensis]